MDTEALTILRKEIDLLDGALLDLLQKRAYLSKQVAKAKQGGTIFYPLREKEIVAKLQELNLSASGEEKKQVLPSESIRHIWTEIFSCSRSLQQKTSLAFLGPAGTFFSFCRFGTHGKKSEFCALP